MSNPKQDLKALIEDIKAGKVSSNEFWGYIKNSKDKYVEELGQQSWNSYIGNRFQALIHAILVGYTNSLKRENQEFQGLNVLTEGQAKHDQIIMRKLAVKYGDFLLLPDLDSIIVWHNFKRPWESEVLAIVSCKTSLRERIAQSCYWKLALLSSDITKGIQVFLATTDNDDNFILKEGRERYQGMHRNRVISEYELDGVYILRDDFGASWESSKVKYFDRIFEDLVTLLKNRAKL